MLSKDAIYGVGDPTKFEADWPRDPEAVFVVETGEYLLPDECAVKMNQIARELLSLKSLPEMAEVDALEEEIDTWFNGIRQWSGAHGKLAAIARRSIATAQAERQRADEALVEFGRQTMEQSARNETKLIQKDEQIATLTAERDEARSLNQVLHDQRADAYGEGDEARRLLAWLMSQSLDGGESLVIEGLKLRANLGNPEATRILELCNGGRDDA